MKIALSYKFTGEDYIGLKEFLDNVCKSLKKAGHEPWGTYTKKEEFDKNRTSLKEIMLTALDFIDKSDCHLVIINSQEKSEGMLLEIGYSYAKRKRIIVAIKKGIKTTWIKEIIPEIIEFESDKDLFRKLEKIQ
jgi:nucleoside 2-deoxyribosyltransferase